MSVTSTSGRSVPAPLLRSTIWASTGATCVSPIPRLDPHGGAETVSRHTLGTSMQRRTNSNTASPAGTSANTSPAMARVRCRVASTTALNRSALLGKRR